MLAQVHDDQFLTAEFVGAFDAGREGVERRAMNIVSIMAHQDDEMRCLGTMLKCRARGDKLAFVTLSDGSPGLTQNPGIERAAGTKIRHDEMSALAGAVDAQYVNLRELDSELYDTPQVRLNLIEAIRITKADVIFTHCESAFAENARLSGPSAANGDRHWV
jgi:LmbE family N-acetylglucosaminyl deacetylase